MHGSNSGNSSSKVTGDTVSRRLREYYDSVMDEAIPDKFLDLLEKLDAADRDHKSRQAAQSADHED